MVAIAHPSVLAVIRLSAASLSRSVPAPSRLFLFLLFAFSCLPATLANVFFILWVAWVLQKKEEKKKYEGPVVTRVGKKKKKKGPVAAHKLPQSACRFPPPATASLALTLPPFGVSGGVGCDVPVFPTTRCRLKHLKLERVKDFLLLEEEFVQSQEVLKPRDEKNQEERTKVDDIRGSPMSVGSLEEIIDDNHAIVSSSVGPEYYVNILSFVDKDELEPGCAVLLHNKVSMPAPTQTRSLPPARAPASCPRPRPRPVTHLRSPSSSHCASGHVGGRCAARRGRPDGVGHEGREGPDRVVR